MASDARDTTEEQQLPLPKLEIYSTSSNGISPFWREKYERDAKKYWDVFYKRHQDRFFKDRHYLDKEWGHYFSVAERKVILEVGCGAGNTIFPLIATYPNIFVHACDFSPRAINLIKTHKDFMETHVNAFVCDLTADDLSTQISLSSVDIVTMIFVLSAVSPEKMPLVLENIRKVLKPNGYVLFRDYATGDLAQERFSCKDQKISENFYVRGDGTRAFYFSDEFLIKLFNENGFDIQEHGLCCKQVENRSREIIMNRRWVQAVFRLHDANSLHCTKTGNGEGLFCKGGSIPELKENNLEDPVNDFEIDMSDGMAVEMFGISTFSDEIIEVNLRDSIFKIKVLSREYQHTCKSTGLMLWESAQLMASVFAANPTIVAGKRVLELGCGCGGICSMVAVSSADLVVATDGDATALDLLTQNVAANLRPPSLDKLITKRLEWGNREHIEAIKELNDGGFDASNLIHRKSQSNRSPSSLSLSLSSHFLSLKMTTDLLQISLTPHPKLTFSYLTDSNIHCSRFNQLLQKRRHLELFRPLSRRKAPNIVFAKAVEFKAPSQNSPEFQPQQRPDDSSVLLDVTGMMCGACVSRVKSILSSDDRVDSVVVNMLTETAAIRLKPGAEIQGNVAEDFAGRLTECGFPAKGRVSGLGVQEKVRKWKEMVEKKEALLVDSRNRVAFAWTLVALCCGSHASHILHSLGIHVSHGSFWEILHNPYVKGSLSLGALLGPGRDLLFDGLRALMRGSPNMNSLVGFGSIAAFIISAVSLLNTELKWDASFFDEPVMLLGFVLLGRSLEEKARIKASSDMNELLSLISTQSRLVITPSESNSSAGTVLCSGAICIEVPTDDIRVGDSVLVLPGETIPVDGIVLAGRSVVDESMLSGESLPVFKEEGLTVSAGTINWDGPLRIEASSTGSNSTIAKIVHLVEDAQGHEAPIQRLADTIAGPFVYSVMTLSAVTFAFWYYVGTHIFPDVLLNDIAGSDGNSLLLSLKLSVDVLVVSCPCALGLATPTAILVGTSLGAKQGLLIRGGDVLERLAGIDFVALDKTGTLTEGKPSFSALATLVHEESEILQIAAAVERTASHPIAKAIVTKAESLNLNIPTTKGQLTEPGFGSLAEVDGRLVAVGTLQWVHERFQQKSDMSDLKNLEQALMHQPSDGKSSDHSKTVVYVGREGEGIIGAIAISDNLRHDAVSTVNRLCQKGIKTVILSGDREEAVASIAKTVGIGSEYIHASLSPQQKSGVISTLQASGHRVAMVGDGINDAPSLALANVGIALQIEAQENAASNTASIILLGNKLSQVVDALDLAQATMMKVHQNLSWAVAYNVVAIPIAAGLLLPQFDFAMTPSLSGGLMALSSIFVVTNSLLLQLHGSQKNRRKSFLAHELDPVHSELKI